MKPSGVISPPPAGSSSIYPQSLHRPSRQPSPRAESGHEPEFITSDGRRVVRCYRTVARDRFHQTGHHELLYDITHPDGRRQRIVHAFALRYLFRFEAEHLLARAGFTVEHLYADFDRRRYGANYPGDLIFVARKL